MEKVNLSPILTRRGFTSHALAVQVLCSSTQKGRFSPEVLAQMTPLRQHCLSCRAWKVLGILTTWFAQHELNPYPNDAERQELLDATGLRPQQLKNWFINHRKRSWQGSAQAEARAAISSNGWMKTEDDTLMVLPGAAATFSNCDVGSNCGAINSQSVVEEPPRPLQLTLG